MAGQSGRREKGAVRTWTRVKWGWAPWGIRREKEAMRLIVCTQGFPEDPFIDFLRSWWFTVDNVRL